MSHGVTRPASSTSTNSVGGRPERSSRPPRVEHHHLDVPDTYVSLLLPFRDRRVVVCGSTGFTIGHIAALRDGGADVTVVAPTVSATISDLAGRGQVTWHAREVRAADLDPAWLAVIGTGDLAEDRRIEEMCDQRRLWCLVEDRGGPPVAAQRHGVSGSRQDGASVTGRVTLVGGGPGDPGLLTVAGRNALAAADVVVVDRLAPVAVLAEVAAGVEVIDVGKVPFGRSTPQDTINGILVARARRGQHVVRLKGGDSFLFGRGGEERDACVAAGVHVEVIPGVTSAFAVPAMAGVPVTHRGLSQGVSVVSGHVPPDHPESTIDYGALAVSGTTIVLLMAVRTLPEITVALLANGMDPNTRAVTIADGTIGTQRTVIGTLATIAGDVASAEIAAPAITVIGPVAAYASGWSAAAGGSSAARPDVG